MLRRAAALALVLLALPVRAQEDAPRAAKVAHATILLPSGAELTVQGGFWLSHDTALARARELEGLRAENAQLRQDAGRIPLAPIAVAVLTGAAAGFLLARKAR